MDIKDDARAFLISRRARITPGEVGLKVNSAGRRVPGLRREEVAQLARVSVDYYTRLEQGSLGGASDGVLDAVSRALRLDDAERAYLAGLARASREAGPEPRYAPSSGVRPSVQRILDSMSTTPALVRNSRLDIVAVNAAGRALYSPMVGDGNDSVNLMRFCFLDEAAREFYPDWGDAADAHVALLRAEAGRDPYDRHMHELVCELTARSDEFRDRWLTHDVRLRHHGTKRFRHPVVGDLEFAYEAFDLHPDHRLALTAYSAPAGSESADKLALLASWQATEGAPQRESSSRQSGST